MKARLRRFLRRAWRPIFLTTILVASCLPACVTDGFVSRRILSASAGQYYAGGSYYPSFVATFPTGQCACIYRDGIHLHQRYGGGWSIFIDFWPPSVHLSGG